MATENDKVNTGALATLVAVGTAAMIGVCLAVNALVRHEVGSVSVERDAVGSDAYRALKKEQLDKLTAPAAWSNQAKGQVSIPIERAMNLVLADLKRSPWNATPAPPPDAGADAAPEAADAGTDAATSDDTDAGAAPEPPASASLSPSAAPLAPPASAPPAAAGGAPATKPSAAPSPVGSVQPVPRPLQTTPPKPPAPPTPPSTQPPATP